MSRFRKWMAALALLALKAAVGACALLALAEPAAAAPLKEIKARGRLVVLSFPHQESQFIRVDVERGLGFYQGVDFDLMQELARSLGVALEVKAVKPTFGALIPALLDGEGDLIASSFTITAERRRKLVFSRPYFAVETVVVARKGRDFKGPADLAGKVGSVVQGSSLHERVKALSSAPPHYVEFTRWNYDAVSGGQADFTVLDATGTWHLLPIYPDLEVAFTLPGVDHYGFAFAPGNEDLRDAVDAYLAQIHASGQLD
ncbi:MAG TPA: transporter substrate-binding domain-containing protein, partial [Thermoanaerobaculia bacterium]|nr:transporter substrate-binding domain-containing protein [Thermoanaerobaculia bacterium]